MKRTLIAALTALAILLTVPGLFAAPVAAATAQPAPRAASADAPAALSADAAPQVDEAILTAPGDRRADGSLRAPANGEAVPLTFYGAELPCEGQLLGDTTYLPLRVFCDFFDCPDVRWDENAKTATVMIGGEPLTATEGSGALEYRGRVLYTGRETVNRDGTLYVPCRPLCKALGLAVHWDNATRSVDLTEGERFAPAAAVYDSGELYWLAHIIGAEAGIEPFLGQIAVGNVVLNRVRAENTPNTIYDVIFDRNYGVQFTPCYEPADAPRVYETPNASCWRAAKICLEGYSLSADALYFYAPQYVYAAWIEGNCRYCFTIAGHKFFA